MKPVNVHPYGIFDNNVKHEYKHIEVKPYTSAMGAEIRGVDLTHLSDEQAEEIKDALCWHRMAFFRGQEHMTHADHLAFANKLGTLGKDAYSLSVEGYEGVQALTKEANERVKFAGGGAWHTDSSFLEEPPSFTLFRAVDVPPYGGDTWFADTQTAYAALSDTMKSILAPLKVHMSAKRAMEANKESIGAAAAAANQEMTPEQQGMFNGRMQPLVRTHPVTGKKCLYVDDAYSCGIEGMHDAEAQWLIDYLVAHITQPAFTCRVHWENGMMGVWDNRACLHHAFNDYDGFRREVYRSTISGDKPY
jgi:taurine dioxygenase